MTKLNGDGMDQPGKGKLFAQLGPASAAQEQITALLQRPGLRIERIVSHGQCSPAGFWYDQAEHEWVLLLQGSAGLELEGENAIRHLRPGDYVSLPAHCRHRVAYTAAGEATIWLAVFWSDA
ncbi:MAG: hypothetical protein JWP36_2849 [Paucimonas sp.]|nr:hypothetical protein [Paucimonas sp.]